jgi:hypothetical protein
MVWSTNLCSYLDQYFRCGESKLQHHQIVALLTHIHSDG